MLKNISRLKCEVDGKEYVLLCDQDSPLLHVKEALFQFQKYVGQIEDQIRSQQEKSEPEKKEEAKPEADK